MNKRVFRLKQDVVIPAGTLFGRASNGHGGDLASETSVELGPNAQLWVILWNHYVDDNDAPDWVEEVL